VTSHSLPQPHIPVSEPLQEADAISSIATTPHHLLFAFNQTELPEELELVGALVNELVNAHDLLDRLGIPREDDYGVCTLVERIAWIADLRPTPSIATELAAHAN
jgi:hypothetical protein